MDIRTWGKVGYKIYAVSDGYIKRIRTGSKGYGKVLYIQLNDGNTAVYAHLERFTPTLNETVRLLQEYFGSYTIDHNFEPKEFPVRKGDLVGYTGDTGSISGPHLHFELRDNQEHPLNPLSFFSIKDNFPPIPHQLAVIPLQNKSRVNGHFIPQLLHIKRTTAFEYYIQDTIYVDGEIGLALDVVDRIDDQPFNFGVYDISLAIDNNVTYNSHYDEYQFEDARYIYTERNYLLKQEKGQSFYHLFTQFNNEQLFFIDNGSDGRINFNDSLTHTFEIAAKDYNDNEITVSGYIKTQKVPVLNFQTSKTGNAFSIIDTQKMVANVEFKLTGIHPEDKSFDVLISKTDDAYQFPKVEKPFTVLEVKPYLNDGTPLNPQYISNYYEYPLNVSGKTRIKQYIHGVVFQFEENAFTGLNAQLSLEQKGKQKSYPMYRIEKNILSTLPIEPIELRNINYFDIIYDTQPPYVFRDNISSMVTVPGKDFKLSYNAGEVTISGSGNIYHDTTFIWIDEVEAPLPKNGKIVSGPFQMGSYLVPQKKKMAISTTVFESHKLNSSGIFYFDQNKEEWYYMNTDVDTKTGELQTQALSGEIFAVIQEFSVPQITGLYPGVGGSYRQQDFSSLEFFIDDEFSGIDGEKNISIRIDDGKPLIFEYNIHQKRVFYSFTDWMSIGEHTLDIEAKDNVGNSTKIRGIFNIK